MDWFTKKREKDDSMSINLDDQYIAIIQGKLRQGKGILATKLALKDANLGNQVKSNYNIKHANCTKIDFIQLVKLLELPRQNPPVTLCLDELYAWLDSYISSSKANRFASYLIFQSAKLGYNLIITTQLIMRLLNSIRGMATKRYLAYKDSVGKRFIYQELDSNSPDENIPIGNGVIITFEQASKFWDLYDTFEPVEPLGLDSFIAEIVKNNPKKMNDFINNQVEILYKEYEKKPFYLNNIAIKSHLLAINQPIVFYDFVLYRLQSKIQKDKS